MTLETLDLQTGPNPVATLVVLHGLGADGNDFVPIARELDLRAVGPVRFVFPHAPVRPVTLNGGYRMRAWYDILGSELERSDSEDEAGLRASRLDIDALLAREVALGVPASRTVLMGFSQGCAMALMTGLRAKERLAGIVGLSGYLPLAARTAAEATDANRLTPIFMGHGLRDGVVPHDRGAATRDRLRLLGYDIEWHDYPMQHSTCPEEIGDVNRFLLKVLRPA
jgi:phospholipase/carboxylesterase